MEELKETQTQHFSNEDINKLIAENNYLKGVINELNDVRGIKRLEFLFKILKFSNFFSTDIISKTASEITEALFSSEDVKSTEENCEDKD